MMFLSFAWWLDRAVQMLRRQYWYDVTFKLVLFFTETKRHCNSALSHAHNRNLMFQPPWCLNFQPSGNCQILFLMFWISWGTWNCCSIYASVWLNHVVLWRSWWSGSEPDLSVRAEQLQLKTPLWTDPELAGFQQQGATSVGWSCKCSGLWSHSHTHTPSLPLQRQRERGWKKIGEEKESLRGSCEGERERERC